MASRIMLVEDEEMVMEVCREMLGRCGFDVVTAATAKQALELYGRLEGRVDLVALDLGLPDMSGLRCLELLLEMDPQARVVLTSGCPAPAGEGSHLAARARDFVPKPYAVKDFVERIESALRG